MVHKLPTKQNGFTLIETFVAITVLLVAIVGPMTIASRGLASAAFAKQQLTASYLAQEAVEYIHNTRTTNILDGSSFGNGLGACLGGNTCRIDVWDGAQPVAACSGACPLMRFEGVTGRYGYDTGSGWEDTIYTRTVQITAISSTPDEEEYEIEVSVNWSGGLVSSKTVTVRDHILNWQ